MTTEHRFFSVLRNLRMRLLRRQEDDAVRETADFLEGVPFFSPLSRSMLLEIAEAVHERTYRRDEFVYFEEDPGIGFFVVRSGQVRILVEDEEGNAREIRSAREGQVVGWTGVLGEGSLRRAETVQATCDVRLVGVFSPELRTLQRRHPKTGSALAGLLNRQFALVLDETRHRLTELEDRVTAGTILSEAEERAAARLGELHGHQER